MSDRKDTSQLWEDMSPEFRQKISSDVFGGGFGSELKARQIFAEEGYDSSAFYYHDKDVASAGGKGGNTREVDILAHSRRELIQGDFRYHIIGEVKKGFTWVLGDAWDMERFEAVGAISAGHPEWLTNHCLWNRGDGEVPRGGPDAGALTDGLDGLPLLPGHVSTSLHQHRSEEAVDWYAAAVKVAKACAAFVPPPRQIRRGVHDYFPNANSVVPLLILDGNLLAVKREVEGELTLEPRDHGLLRFAFGSANYPETVTFLHIVRLRGLASFIRRVSEAESKLSVIAKRLHRGDPGPYNGP